jgi:fructose-specific phosphotransferase system IIC component
VTPLHWALAGAAALLLLALAGLLAYTVSALLAGRRTVSGYLKHAPRLVVFVVGLAAGFVAGLLAGHWWFPTVGD